MLEYKNKKLTVNNIKIDSSEFILQLISDVDGVITGKFTFSDGSKKYLNFVKYNDVYKARLLITEDIIDKLNYALFKINLLNMLGK